MYFKGTADTTLIQGKWKRKIQILNSCVETEALRD